MAAALMLHLSHRWIPFQQESKTETCTFVLLSSLCSRWSSDSSIHTFLSDSLSKPRCVQVSIYIYFRCEASKNCQDLFFLQVLNFSNVITLHKKERCIKHIYFFRGKKHEKIPHLRPQGFFIIFLRGCSAYLENYWSKYLIFFIISW